MSTQPAERETTYWSSDELRQHMEVEHGGTPTGGSQPDLVQFHRTLHDQSGVVYGARHIHIDTDADYRFNESHAPGGGPDGGQFDSGGGGGGSSDHAGVDHSSHASVANHLANDHPGSAKGAGLQAFMDKHGYTAGHGGDLAKGHVSAEALIHYGVSKGIDKLRELHANAHAGKGGGKAGAGLKSVGDPGSAFRK